MKDNNIKRNNKESSAYDEQEFHLADLTLRDIEAGKEVFQAIRGHPLPGGAGFLSKYTLI